MSLAQLIVLSFATTFLSTSPLHAMENQDKPDFVICNEHDQNVKVSLTFEYKEINPFIAEHSNILIPTGQKYPVFIKQLDLINPESKSLTALSELNLEYMIIRVDRPKVPLKDTGESPSVPSLTDEDVNLETIESDIDPSFQPGGAALVFLGNITYLVITETDTNRLEITGWKDKKNVYKSI